MEIRKRLFFIIAIFFVAGILGFLNYEHIISLSLKLFNFPGVNVVFTSPFQFIDLAINSGILIGLVAVFPLIILQILSFLKPALKAKEYKIITRLVPLTMLLFLAGFTLGVFIMRYVVVLFYQKSLELDIGNFLDVSQLLSQTLLTAVLMGLAFQFPIILTVLIRLKLIKYQTLAEQRLIAYSASIVFAALLPPTDLLSLVLLTLPLAILFELTLLLNRPALNRRHRQ